MDTYVLESDVHFPTDLNLLWDSGRKCVDLVEKYRDQFGYALPGWRKAKEWQRQLKACERTASHVVYRGGPNKEARVPRAVRDYLAVDRALSAKVAASLLGLSWTRHTGRRSPTSTACWPNTSTWSHAGCCTRKPLRRTRKSFHFSSRTPNGSSKASSGRTWNWATAC